MTTTFYLRFSSDNSVGIDYYSTLVRIRSSMEKATGVSGLWDQKTGLSQRKFRPFGQDYSIEVLMHFDSFEVFTTVGTKIADELTLLKIVYLLEEMFEGVAHVEECGITIQSSYWALPDLCTCEMRKVFGMTEEEYVDMWVRDVGPIL